jgi:hypothetical protein
MKHQGRDTRILESREPLTERGSAFLNCKVHWKFRDGWQAIAFLVQRLCT